jgi:hypothetical protein
LSNGDNIPLKNHEIAGDVRSEQPVQPEKADGVNASGDDAQHNWQSLCCKRIINGYCSRASVPAVPRS